MTDSPKKVLVTGGAGFIGSHVCDAYLARGDSVWVVDNLSSGKRENVPEGATVLEMDIRDDKIRDLFREVRFDLVNHHAAQIDVRISVADPLYDAQVNLLGLLNLLEGAREVGTDRFIYVSSGGVVYGEPEVFPTPEVAPKLPLSPYGVTKLSGEFYLNYYREIHGLEYVALRYANVYGPRQDPHGEAGVVGFAPETNVPLGIDWEVARRGCASRQVAQGPRAVGVDVEDLGSVAEVALERGLIRAGGAVDRGAGARVPSIREARHSALPWSAREAEQQGHGPVGRFRGGSRQVRANDVRDRARSR